MLSPIQTRRHWITSIAFEHSEKLVEKPNLQLQLTLNTRKCKEHWHVRLKVSVGGRDSVTANYKVEIDFEGIFDIHPKFPAEQTEDLVRMNGGAVLYGAVRELVLNLTARSKHGPFEMPTIDARMFVKKPESGATSPVKSSGHPKLAQPVKPALPAAPAPPRSPAAKKAPKPKGEA